MKINPNLRYCEHSYWCKHKNKIVNVCYLGWKVEDYLHEYKEGGLYCHSKKDKKGDYIWRKNISGFELMVKISLYEDRRANGKKKRNSTEIC